MPDKKENTLYLCAITENENSFVVAESTWSAVWEWEDGLDYEGGIRKLLRHKKISIVLIAEVISVIYICPSSPNRSLLSVYVLLDE